MVGNDAVNWWDYLGLEEQFDDRVPNELENLADLYENSEDEELKETSEAVRKLISAFEEKKETDGTDVECWKDQVKIAYWAVYIWATESAKKCYDRDLLDYSTCNFMVADSVFWAGYDVPFVKPYPFKKRVPRANEWYTSHSSVSVTFTLIAEWEAGEEYSDKCKCGDIISYQGHIGIYLGNGIYISSTAGTKAGQSNTVIIKKLNRYLDTRAYRPRGGM